MAEQKGENGMKYCPSCRNVLEYLGEGKYECLLCCTHVVVLDKDPDIFYEVSFTEEEREAYYLARKERIRNRVFFERERERETKKKEAVKKEQDMINRLGEGHEEPNNRETFDAFLSSRTMGNMPLTKEEEPEQVRMPKQEQGKKCTICGKPIPSGIYCKECTFEQIKKMQMGR